MEERPLGQRFRRVAAIDIGTVTTRLLVADTDGTEVREVSRVTTVTHLGEGLHATGELSKAGLARVADAVAAFGAEIARVGADEVVAVATSAARDASNASDLVATIRALGVPLRVIAGDVEARLSFTGATYGLEGEGILVDDLGGGSTELILGAVQGAGEARTVDIDAARSLDVGSRRVKDMFLGSDPPTAGELAAASEWVVAQIRPFFDGLRERPNTLITLAGTGTTLSAIEQGLVVYDPKAVHGSRLSGGIVADLRAELAALDLESRRCVTGMDPARADVIVAGALILETVMALAGLDETVVSEHDILYGLVLAGAAGLE
jgi:exopolyphosphatase/guanosine-5'-triphosphate,3'-diphosphate pyrophosphatase